MSLSLPPFYNLLHFLLSTSLISVAPLNCLPLPNEEKTHMEYPRSRGRCALESKQLFSPPVISKLIRARLVPSGSPENVVWKIRFVMQCAIAILTRQDTTLLIYFRVAQGWALGGFPQTKYTPNRTFCVVYKHILQHHDHISTALPIIDRLVIYIWLHNRVIANTHAQGNGLHLGEGLLDVLAWFLVV